MQYLRQATAAVLRVGPFVSATDGKTPVLGLAAPAGKLIQGATATAYTPSAWAELGDGHYAANLSSGQAATAGPLRAEFPATATYLSVWEDADVVTGAWYDLAHAANGSGGIVAANGSGQIVAADSAAAQTAYAQVATSNASIGSIVTGTATVNVSSGSVAAITTAVNAAVQAGIINDADGTAIIQAIADKVAAEPSLTTSAIAAAAATAILVTPANKIANGAGGKVAATIAAGDDANPLALTAQQVRDALRLAPSGGAGQMGAGSVTEYGT